jgi:hypothetical protein
MVLPLESLQGAIEKYYRRKLKRSREEYGIKEKKTDYQLKHVSCDLQNCMIRHESLLYII